MSLSQSSQPESDVKVEVLLKKGKRGAAAYIQAECARSSRPDNLNAVLDTLLDPLKPIDEWETIEWLRWLMAGGITPDEFTATVRRYDNATTCGLVWTANFVAYRCRTCGISPCMSLCAECFQRGNHHGHDFNMFRSQAGGACDCGDTNVMKESGFCYLHGPAACHDHSKPPDGGAPSDLLCVANAMMPRLILRLIQHMRQNSNSLDGFLGAVQAADKFITMLYDLSSMGAAMRQVMTHALTNPQVYKSLIDFNTDEVSKEYEDFMNSTQRYYDEALGTLGNPLPPDEFQQIPSLRKSLIHRTFLQELVFWTAKFEFPQKIVCLLLNLLPDAEYKEAFTRAFVLHYSRISQLLVRSLDPDMLSNRVVHVSVQLFSNEKLALQMTEEMSLLHVMVISLHYMMHAISMMSPLHEKDGILIEVVDCAHPVMKDHCYWPLVSDLNNILSHRPVALKFLQDDGLLAMWFNFLGVFQGMNMNQREMNSHVEFEPTTYYAAFSAELEASASPMWALVSHLRDASTANLTKNLLWHCKRKLKSWLQNVKFGEHENESLQVSFHLPLHRYFAVFLYQAVRNQGMSLSELLPPPHELKLMILHPLRVQVAFYEIISGLWVRNGLQIKGQAMTYIQCHFCNSMVDADLFLLQVGLMNIPTSEFITSIFEKFHVIESLSISSSVTNTYFEPEQEMLMMENCLIFLATLSSVRTAIGMRDGDLVTLEMVTLLCMGDKTHSQLMELMPERCGNSSQSKDFESVLAKVADYKAPNFESSGNMMQGMYAPKPFVWETLYDPIYILLRSVHRRDFQTSMDRFSEYVKHCGKFKGSESPWPPFRIPEPVAEPYTDPRKILLSRVVQGVLFVVFYKGVHTSQLSDQVVSLAVYLLEMGLSVCEEGGGSQAVAQHEVSYGRYDMDFETWFSTDDLLANLRTEVDSVVVKPPAGPHHQTSDAVEISVDEMEVESWEEGEGETLGLYNSNYGPVAAYNNTGDYPMMEDSNGGGGAVGGALALMPPTQAVVPSTTTTAASRLDETVLQVVLASNRSQANKAIGNVLKSELIERSSSMGGNQPSTEVIINESMISLLLKLHSKLSSTPDSYTPFWELPKALQIISEAKSGLSNGLEIKSQVGEETPPPEPGRDSSFSYLQLYSLVYPEDSRIGDGPFFVGKVLDKMCAKDDLCRENLIYVRERLWPRKAEDEEAVRAREEKEKEEKKRKARERQSKLIAEFAKKQQQFMESAMTREYNEDMGGGASGGGGGGGGAYSDDGMMSADTSRDHDMMEIKPIEYDCVICNQTSASTSDNPVGLVILLQPSSVLAHRSKQGTRAPFLPTRDSERWSNSDTMSAHIKKRLEILDDNFDESSWLQSISGGWEGGVHVSTCGHHIHMECLKGYLAALKSQQRQHNISVERGEYLCPLCRQLANSFLPLSPEFGIRQSALVKDRKSAGGTPLTPETTVPEIPPSPESNVALEVVKLLREHAFPTVYSRMMDAMTKTMEEMTNATHLKYRQICSRSSGSSKNTRSIVLFVSSIARTNLELELVFRGGHLVSEPQPSTSSASQHSSISVSKRSCIVPLLHVLGVHYKILSTDPCAPKMWERVLGIRFFPADSSLTPLDREVPMLLRDPVTILLHLLMQLPMHVDLAFFNSIVQGIFNLVYIQILTSISSSFKKSDRDYWKSKMSLYSSSSGNPNQLFFLLGTVIRYLEEINFYLGEDEESVSSSSQRQSHSSSSTSSSPYVSSHREDEDNMQHLAPSLKKNLKKSKSPYYPKADGGGGGSSLGSLGRSASTSTSSESPSAVPQTPPSEDVNMQTAPFTPSSDYYSSRGRSSGGSEQGGGVFSSSVGTPESPFSLGGGSRAPEEEDVNMQHLPTIAFPTEYFSSICGGLSPRASPFSSSVPPQGTKCREEEEVESLVESLLLPYLRIAALLRHHIYEQDLPVVSSAEGEFGSLAEFLALGRNGEGFGPGGCTSVFGERRESTEQRGAALRAHSFLSWITPTPLTAIWTWCEEVGAFIGRAQMSCGFLLRSHKVLWMQPALMELPHAYDVIFQYYHRKRCGNCNTVPKDPNICLVCGALVCMRDTCCKSAGGVCEAIQHSIDCGAGTVMYLSVNSSTIVVVRGRRACLWGSVYLDSFGEEDRELKRGKPLFLSKERYALLQQQWLSHRFDHTSRKWIWHRENL